MATILVTIFACLIISYQDFRERKVNVFLFPAVFFTGIFINISQGINQLIWQIGLNLIYLFISSFLVAVYFLIKYSDFKKIKQQYGAGDILFLVCISPYFNLDYYIIFLSGSFLICLIFFLPFCIRNKAYPIPLAGFQSLLFIPTIYLWINGFNLFRTIDHLIF